MVRDGEPPEELRSLVGSCRYCGMLITYITVSTEAKGAVQ